MTNKKKTIPEHYAEIIAAARYGAALTEEQIAFLEDRAEKSAKKTENRKPTATQIENEATKEAIVKVMSANPNMIYTIGDLQKNVPELANMTNQKVSAIVRQLKEDLVVTRTVDKGRAYFQIAK